MPTRRLVNSQKLQQAITCLFKICKHSVTCILLFYCLFCSPILYAHEVDDTNDVLSIIIVAPTSVSCCIRKLFSNHGRACIANRVLLSPCSYNGRQGCYAVHMMHCLSVYQLPFTSICETFMWVNHCALLSHPPEARGLCFCPVLFIYLFISWLVQALKVAGTVVHLRYLVIEELGMHGPLAGGCRINNVLQ